MNARDNSIDDVIEAFDRELSDEIPAEWELAIGRHIATSYAELKEWLIEPDYGNVNTETWVGVGLVSVYTDRAEWSFKFEVEPNGVVDTDSPFIFRQYGDGENPTVVLYSPCLVSNVMDLPVAFCLEEEVRRKPYIEGSDVPSWALIEAVDAVVEDTSPENHCGHYSCTERSTHRVNFDAGDSVTYCEDHAYEAVDKWDGEVVLLTESEPFDMKD